MAELPRIVIALKGSITLLVASQTFCSSVNRSTCVPFWKRAYQSRWGARGGQDSCCRLALRTGLFGLDAIAPAAPACTGAVAALFVWQGPAAGTLMCAGSNGWGASGSGSGVEVCDWPAQAGVVRRSRSAGRNAIDP